MALRGSTVALTDQTGKLTDRYQYGPYGEMVKHDGATVTPFQYGGQYGVETDANGLNYMRARYYSPEIRRFINQDILIGSIDDSQSLNRFAYVNGNPVDSTDPFGLFSLKNSFNKIKTSFNTAQQAVKQVVNQTKKVVSQAAKQVEKVVSQAYKTIKKPSTLKTIRNVAGVVGGVAAVASLVVAAPVAATAVTAVAGASLGFSIFANIGLWAQDKDRFKTDHLLNFGGNLLLDAAPFGIGRIAKIGSSVRKADTLMQMVKDNRGWQAAVRVMNDSFSFAMGLNAATALVTGTNTTVESVLVKNNKSNKDK